MQEGITPHNPPALKKVKASWRIAVQLWFQLLESLGTKMKWSCNLLGEHKRAAGSDRWLHSQLDFSKLPGVDSWFKKVFLWIVRLTSDFLLSSAKKTTQLVRNLGASHYFLSSNCYPPLSLWSAGFSKSWGNRWPWLYPVEQRTEHRFHRSKRAGRVRKIISFSIHPSPNTTNHPVSWEISLLQSLWVILVLANKDKDGEKRHPDKSTVPFCLTNFYCYNF